MLLKFEDFLNEDVNKRPNIRTIQKNLPTEKLMDELINWFGNYLKRAMSAFGVGDYKCKPNEVISYRQDEDIDEMYNITFKFKGGGGNDAFLKNQSYVSFDFIIDKPIEKYTFATLKDEFLDKLTLFIQTDFSEGEMNGNDYDKDVSHIRITLYNAIIMCDKKRKDDKLNNLLKNMEYDGKVYTDHDGNILPDGRNLGYRKGKDIYDTIKGDD